MVPGEVIVYVRHAVGRRGRVGAHKCVVVGGTECARGVAVDEIFAAVVINGLRAGKG